MGKWLKSMARPLALILGAVAFAALTVNALRSGQGPNPVNDVGAWSDWAGRDPVNALVMLVSALLAGVGAWGTVQGFFKPAAASRDDVGRAAGRTEAAVAGADAASARRDADMAEHIRRLEAKIEAMMVASVGGMNGAASAAPDTETGQAGVARTLASVAASTSPEMAPAREAIRQEDPRAVVEALMQTQGDERLQRLKEAATLAARFDLEMAERAYRLMLEIEPTAETIKQLADIRFERGDLEGCLALLDEASTVVGDPAGQAGALITRVHYALNWGQSTDGVADRLQRAKVQLIIAGDTAVAKERLLWVDILAGDLAQRLETPDEALKAYRDAVTVEVPATDAEDWRLKMAFIGHDRIANLHIGQGDFGAAREAALKALAFVDLLLRRNADNDVWQSHLIHAHSRLGYIDWSLEKTAPALEHYSRATDKAQAMYERNPGSTERLWILLDAMGNQLRLLQQTDRAEESSAKTRQFVELAGRLPTSGLGGKQLAEAADTLKRQGSYIYWNGDRKQAAPALEAAHDIRRRLMADGRLEAKGRAEMVDGGPMLIDALRLGRRTADALTVATVVSEVNDGLVMAAPDDVALLLQAARLHGMRAEVYESAGLFQEAVDAYGRVRTSAAAVLQIEPDNATAAGLHTVSIQGADAARARLKA